MATMPHWLDQRAYLTPDRPAILSDEATWTYGHLRAMALGAFDWLSAEGLRSKEPVSLLISNRPQSVALIHALTYARAVVVLLNTRLAVPELAPQVQQSESRWLIYDRAHRGRAYDVAGAADLRLVEVDQIFDRPRVPPTGDRPMAHLDLDEDHGLIYTSGTTGRAKGVRLTYGNHWWSAVGSALNLGLSGDDRWLLALPLFHVSGLSVLFRSVIYGTAVVLHDQFQAERVHADIHRYHVTLISVVATMLERMLDQSDSDYPGPLRAVLAGGGPIPLHLVTRALNRGLAVYQTYGLTETASQVVTLSPEHLVSRQGSAGKPLFPAEVQIRRGSEVLLADRAGEIVIRGPMLTPGYRTESGSRPAATSEGWFYTGDVGHLDPDGFLYVHDRFHDLIISGGENVYPAEIEAALCQHPEIADAGVVGTRDETWGQVPVAFIQTKGADPLNSDQIEAFLRQHLAPYKVPRAMYWVDQIPRNAAGKLLRRELARRLLGTGEKQE